MTILSNPGLAPTAQLSRWLSIIFQNFHGTTEEVKNKDEIEAKKEISGSRSLEGSVSKLSEVITKKYIKPWSKDLHLDLAEELSKELSHILLTLTSKLSHIDCLSLLEDTLALLRRHLARLEKVDPENPQDFAFQHPVNNCNIDISREKFVEVCVEKLLLHLNAQRRLTSDLIFNLVKKVIAHQVILRLLGFLKDPQRLAQLIEFLLIGTCPEFKVEITSEQNITSEIPNVQDVAEDQDGHDDDDEEEEVFEAVLSAEEVKKEVPKKLDLISCLKTDQHSKFQSPNRISHALG